jgi:UDP-N-acetylmuramate dehydrogenase
MTIQENISLKPFNTFGIDARARYFSSFASLDELEELLAGPGSRVPQLVLGGGSNILLTKDFDGLVLKNEIRGIEIIREDEEHVYLKAGAGENWHRFVLFCVENNYAGVENLSLIPGQAGASPMQNIGAYGVEIKDVFYELEAFHRKEGKLQRFSLSDCAFGYRDSVFKNKYKDQFVIVNVTYRLNRKPSFHTGYGAIVQELGNMGVRELSIQAISQAVINIRSSKLPDPKKLGNAGSFFKNPVVGNEQFEGLKKEFPGIVGFPSGPAHTKLAAGWLIEQCGWKGYRKGDTGCYPLQALVLVNYGDASGNDIFGLSSEIIGSVESRFGVRLEREVNVIA